VLVALASTITVAGSVFTAGQSLAAGAPTLSIRTAGTGWLLHINTSGNTGCGLISGASSSGIAAGWEGDYPVSGSLAPGQHRIQVVCPSGKSAKLTLFAPRSPINDLRTQFSNSTQGMFGS